MTGSPARAETSLTIDDFENGVGNWARNDSLKTDAANSEATLINVLPTKPDAGGVAGSHIAGLFVFKSAQNSWATASIKVDGAQWAKMGAQYLRFWFEAGGEAVGTDVILRGQIRGTDGVLHEEVYKLPQHVKLSVKKWREVSIPLADFKSADGALLPRLSGVYLLQFAQLGSWDSRFYAVDNLRVTGTGVPIPQLKVTVAATPTPTPSPSPAETISTDTSGTDVKVDFLKASGRIRSFANVSIGAVSGPAEIGSPLLNNQQYQNALQTLHPRFIRLEASAFADLVDSSKPGFDLSRLQSAARKVRSLGSEPLLAINNPPAWGLDEHGYAVFALAAARAAQAGLLEAAPNDRAPLNCELALAAGETDDDTLVALYNHARSAIKGWNPKCRVGGVGASGEQTTTLQSLIANAAGLDFLTVQFYGAASKDAESDSLFESARSLTALRAAAHLLDASKWKDAALYVTQANLSGNRVPGETTLTDSRNVRMIGAAWWVAFLGSSSHVADELFQNDAVDPAWGLLDDQARAFPAYYAMYLWNVFMAGGQRVEVRQSRNDIVAFAANTPTSHNLLLANTTDAELTVHVAIRGFPILRSAKMGVMQSPKDGIPSIELPKSPYQTVQLKPYAIALLQFVEPPHAGATP